MLNKNKNSLSYSTKGLINPKSNFLLKKSTLIGTREDETKIVGLYAMPNGLFAFHIRSSNEVVSDSLVRAYPKEILRKFEMEVSERPEREENFIGVYV